MFTSVTTRIVARSLKADFVDGIQKEMFLSPPAIQATWPPAFAMAGLPPASVRHPSLGTPIVKA